MFVLVAVRAGDDAAAMHALCAGVERSSSLAHLDLNFNHVGESARLLLPVVAARRGP